MRARRKPRRARSEHDSRLGKLDRVKAVSNEAMDNSADGHPSGVKRNPGDKTSDPLRRRYRDNTRANRGASSSTILRTMPTPSGEAMRSPGTATSDDTESEFGDPESMIPMATHLKPVQTFAVRLLVGRPL